MPPCTPPLNGVTTLRLVVPSLELDSGVVVDEVDGVEVDVVPALDAATPPLPVAAALARIGVNAAETSLPIFAKSARAKDDSSMRSRPALASRICTSMLT